MKYPCASYTNCITLQYAIDELDLFDEIPFKNMKYLYNNPRWSVIDADFEVKIEDLEPEYRENSRDINWCRTLVRFWLENPNYDGKWSCPNPDGNENPPPLTDEKYLTFEKIYRYKPDSHYGLLFLELEYHSGTTDDECSDSDSDTEPVAIQL